jgi:alkanesulfonate monooxygenase SsuD/methylene tetrahydromethanopterin reductase-like flavin-dependent oxidoreductase (luciferase family)
MDIGLGLPIADPARLLDWARRADAGPFHTLALLDRLTFDNPEPLVALSVLAGATERIRLQTEVLLGPLRATPLLAKQVATLDRMSGGRFTLGIGVGGRPDDHAAAGVPVGRRGALLDRQLADLRRIWSGEPDPAAGVPIGPAPTATAGPPVLIGGFAEPALRRVARFADGFLCAAPLAWAGRLVDTVRDQWEQAGRPGRPRLVCQVNAAIGPPAVVEAATRAIAGYYAFAEGAGWGLPAVVSDPGELTDLVGRYREFGADELVLYCYGDDPDQVDRFAELLA